MPNISPRLILLVLFILAVVILVVLAVTEPKGEDPQDPHRGDRRNRILTAAGVIVSIIGIIVGPNLKFNLPDIIPSESPTAMATMQAFTTVLPSPQLLATNPTIFSTNTAPLPTNTLAPTPLLPTVRQYPCHHHRRIRRCHLNHLRLIRQSPK